MTIMSSRTPNTVAIVPGEERPEPKTNTQVIKVHVHHCKHQIDTVLWCITQVKGDFGTGGCQTDVIGHWNVNAVDAGVVEEVAEHQLALFGRLHHVADCVNGSQAFCIQNHAAHLFRKAAREDTQQWGQPVQWFQSCGTSAPRIHLPWQVTVISRTFASDSEDSITALSIWTISTFSMASGTWREGGTVLTARYPWASELTKRRGLTKHLDAGAEGTISINDAVLIWGFVTDVSLSNQSRRGLTCWC